MAKIQEFPHKKEQIDFYYNKCYNINVIKK